MFTNFPLFPQQGSAQAGQVDAIYFFMLAVTAFFSILIAGLIVFFAIRYRRRHRNEVGYAIHGSLALELMWTVIPFCGGVWQSIHSAVPTLKSWLLKWQVKQLDCCTRK